MDGGSGRCLCGAVRFSFTGAPAWQSHCHCESCRRATSSPFTSFLSVRQDRVRWQGERRAFASSPGVTRWFCPACGAPLAYETAERPGETDLYAASLDDPSGYAPTLHDHWDEHLPFVRLDDGLPRILSPRRVSPDDDMAPLLALIRECFAYMEGRIDPPSSVHRLTAQSLAAAAREGEVWAILEHGRPVATVTLSRADEALYIGKLAVAEDHRGKGLARQLVDMAEYRAKALGLSALEVQTRVELTDNHAAFRAMGFVQTAETAHEGYARPTSLTFRKPVRGG
jgi:predicted N-acetyltransferase YhbS